MAHVKLVLLWSWIISQNGLLNRALTWFALIRIWRGNIVGMVWTSLVCVCVWVGGWHLFQNPGKNTSTFHTMLYIVTGTFEIRLLQYKRTSSCDFRLFISSVVFISYIAPLIYSSDHSSLLTQFGHVQRLICFLIIFRGGGVRRNQANA